MNRERGVAGVEAPGRRLDAAPIHQVQHVGLQRVQQAVVARFDQVELVPGGARDVGFLQQVEEVPSLAAEGGEQRVADVEMFARGLVARAAVDSRAIVARRGLAPLAEARRLALGAQLAPVVVGRAQQVDAHRDETRQGDGDLEEDRRQGAGTEHAEAPRQAGGATRGAVEELEQPDRAARQVDPAGGARGQRAPQPGLPASVMRRSVAAGQRHGLAGFPVEQHPRSEQLVALEQAGETHRQLIALDLVGIVCEVGCRGRDVGVRVRGLAQVSEDPPGQRFAIEGRGLFRARRRIVAQAVALQALGQPAAEGSGERHGQAGGEPRAVRQLQGQPAHHALALDDDHLALEHRQGLGVEDAGEVLDQDLEAVAGMDAERGLGHDKAGSYAE